MRAPKSPKLPTLQRLWLQHHVYGDGHHAAWFIVRDPWAGRRSVYTVYRISLAGDKAPRVIGRELDLPLARKIVRQDMASSR